MYTLEEVKGKYVLKKAMDIIKRSRKEILATMDLAEEQRAPLPQEYFFLLNSKLRKGVVMRRIAFGTERTFEKFKKRRQKEFKRDNYQCRLASKGYQRMLLVDRKKLLYAEEGKQGRKYWYSEDPSRIKRFLDYFERKWGSQ
jgi:hypothetical protein